MAHPDLDALLDALLQFAQTLLETRDGFFPFGGYLDVGGGLSHVQGWTGDEQPLPQDVIDSVRRGLRTMAEAGELRAAAICRDVRTNPPGRTDMTDAVLVQLEHVNGDAVDVYLPYAKSAAGEYEYGEVFARPGQPEIFQRAEAPG